MRTEYEDTSVAECGDTSVAECEDTAVAECEDKCVLIYLEYPPDLEIHAALVYAALSY